MAHDVKVKGPDGKWFSLMGVRGPTGWNGGSGSDGPPGPGVIAGGSTGQVLAKVSSANYDTTWVNQSGGGGSPGGTNGQIQYNNAGSFGGVTAVPVANGGWGQSMAMQTDSAAGTHNALPSGLVKMTGASGLVVNGIVAAATNTQWIIYNASPSTVTITHQNSSATAANRIITPTGASVNIQAGFHAFGFYDTVLGRNVLLDYNLNMISTVVSPLTLTGNSLGILVANNTQAGALSAADWTSFNSKLNGTSLQVPGILFAATSSDISSNTQLNWDSTMFQLGVQVLSADTMAALDIKSDVIQTITAPASISANLVQVTLPSAPSSGAATEVAPNLPRVSSPTVSQDFVSSGYTDNTNVWNFVIWQGVSDGIGGYTWAVAGTPDGTLTITEGESGNPYGIDFAFTSVSGVQVPDAWLIQRDLNSGGYNDYQIINTVGFVDNNTGWITAAAPLSSKYPDFVAAGQSYNYAAYGALSTGIASPNHFFSSSAFNYGITISTSDGHPFLIHHIIGGSTPDFWVINVNSVNHYAAYGVSGIFDEATNTFSGNADGPTPTTYGILSNGSALTIALSAYKRRNFPLLYSPTSVDASTTDPSDSNYYYVDVSVSGYGSDAPKVIKDSTTGKISAAFRIDGVTTFTDGAGVSPSTYYAPAIRSQTHGSSADNGISSLFKNLDSSDGQIYHSFQDYSGLELGSIKANPDGFVLQGAGSSQVYLAPVSGKLKYNGSTKLQWDTNGLTVPDAVNAVLGTTTGTVWGTATNQRQAWYNATPVVRQIGNPVTAMITYGLLAFPTAITEAQGGTNQTSYAQGDILYASASNTLSKLAKSAIATRYLSNTAANNNPAWSQVNLTNGVTGALPVANGGTGATTLIGAGVVGIVTNVQLTNQSADIGSTNFSNTSTAGLYRVSYTLEDTAADVTAGAVSVAIAYTSAAGATTVTSSPQVLTGAGLTQGTVFVQLSSGSISYSASHTGLFGTAKYALYMTVERLV